MEDNKKSLLERWGDIGNGLLCASGMVAFLAGVHVGANSEDKLGAAIAIAGAVAVAKSIKPLLTEEGYDEKFEGFLIGGAMGVVMMTASGVSGEFGASGENMIKNGLIAGGVMACGVEAVNTIIPAAKAKLSQLYQRVRD